MKPVHRLILVCSALCLLACFSARAQDAVLSADSAGASPRPEDHSLLNGLARGFANVLFGVYELPRNMVYYSIEWPVLGIVPGAMEGTGMSVMRVVGGLADLVTVGYLPPGRTVYDLMEAPMYPWESPWFPPPSEEQ